MLKSSLCDYEDVYMLVKRTITIVGRGADQAGRQANKRNKEVRFKNCAPFTDCISKIIPNRSCKRFRRCDVDV